jgi:hypothetical protein
MTKLELGVVEAFLEAEWDSPEMYEALAEVIAMTDVNRRAWDAKDRSRIARKEGLL